ncbi:manganese efflux pump MntP family protein [Pokkaliibacter sp. CJK22405]|uniref:manganese efflux pump MntP n=1 Tax=Pokkaliibacter sp. CJK22405 TaxID=3384615 RepID=UPI0039852EF1
MSFLALFIIALAMSTDAFAVAIGRGISTPVHSIFSALKIGLLFGLIEGITPLIGWAIGVGASRFITEWDHWVAFAVLLLLGLRMIREGFSKEEEHEEAQPSQAESGMKGVMMTCMSAVATSLDALAVGVSLAFADVSIVQAAIMIGIATTVMVTLGVLLGNRLGELVGKRAEALGGLMLILVGIAIVYEHTHPATLAGLG